MNGLPAESRQNCGNPLFHGLSAGHQQQGIEITLHNRLAGQRPAISASGIAVSHPTPSTPVFVA